MTVTGSESTYVPTITFFIPFVILTLLVLLYTSTTSSSAVPFATEILRHIAGTPPLPAAGSLLCMMAVKYRTEKCLATYIRSVSEMTTRLRQAVGGRWLYVNQPQPFSAIFSRL